MAGHKNYHIVINGLTKLIGSCRNNWIFRGVVLNYSQCSEKKGITAAVNSYFNFGHHEGTLGTPF